VTTRSARLGPIPGLLVAVVAALALVTASAPAPVQAHPFWGHDLCGYDDSGRWAHHHTRRYDFFNGVGDSDWRRQTRDAQLDWHNRTPLRLDTTTEHAVAVDANYGDTGWHGIASSPCLPRAGRHAARPHEGQPSSTGSTRTESSTWPATR
jgi:hypothetical protein